MGGGRKLRRRDGTETPAIHLRNRYAAVAPVFAMLASLYPTTRPLLPSCLYPGAVPPSTSPTSPPPDLRRECGAFQVLKSAETFLHASNLSCKTDSSLFSIDVTLSDEQAQATTLHGDSDSVEGNTTKLHSAVTGISFHILLFEQMPGTILVKGSLLNKALSDIFASTFSQLEDTLKMEFLSKARCALIHRAGSQEATLARRLQALMHEGSVEI
ncbi:hypothetical protein ABZP36_020417 [Zizania latifolia]